MTDAKITQCPKCDTTFRITPAQLKVAKGAVRCGACLHVFRASDHFQDEKPMEAAKQDDRTADMFGNEPEQSKSTPEEKAAPQAESRGLLDELNGSGLIEDEDDFLIDDDNGLIDDDPVEDNGGNAFGELNEEFLSLDAQESDNPFYAEDIRHHEKLKPEVDDDESWAQALLNDGPDEEPVTAKPKPKKAAKATPAASQSLDDTLSEISDMAANKASKFSYIEAEPLDLALPEKQSKLPLALWSVASVIMIAALVGQMAFFNFDQWSRDSQYRPYYRLACEQLGCTLPSSYDVSRIRTTASPQVSSHAKFKNALTVDILFMNDAQYEQAFPLLELSFSDNQDKVIAHRLFKPEEYLAGEAAGLTMMPTQTPIHIALEIQDPGAAASNYQVKFVAPSS